MGYKADFSPWRWRSKCKVSPLPCLPWDSVGGVGQGQFCILHKSGIDSPILWRSPGLSSVRVCWDCWQYGRSAWALVLSGCRLGGALLLSFSGRSSLSLLSRLSVLSLPSPGRRWLCCLTGWGIASAGGGWVSLCPHAGLGCCAGSLGAGAGRCPSLALRSLPLLGAGVPLLSSGAGLLCAGAGCWPWVG